MAYIIGFLVVPTIFCLVAVWLAKKGKLKISLAVIIFVTLAMIIGKAEFLQEVIGKVLSFVLIGFTFIVWLSERESFKNNTSTTLPEDDIEKNQKQ